MQYYRCKCGNATAYGSMGPAPCTRCSKCGSDLALGPSGHSEPDAHTFVTRFDPTNGDPYEVCKRCMRRKSELLSDGEA
jgi:hypothetical protein